MANEFSLINKYFKPLGEAIASPNVVMGIGDDCALLANKPGYQLAVSTDTMVAGVHFFADAHPIDVGYKALAVNLSDLAAMGAEPAWFTLCLTLPGRDENWIKGFVQGIEILAQQFAIPLVGGDTTKGPLSLSIQVAGWVPEDKGLTRSGAKVGDHLYVSGEIGWPYLGYQVSTSSLQLNDADQREGLERFLRPLPKLALGANLIDVASAALDISDGLTADLNHMLTASGIGAELDINALPLAAPLGAMSDDIQRQAINFGDEYQLLFAVPSDKQTQLTALQEQLSIKLYPIGTLVDGPGIVDSQGNPIAPSGYEHF
ncbi:MAG: thiamine-phosphate kinase [Pseudomonadales bacterium]|nr:thiamine-phosphate kinase [Pseudomonadales bacterium]